MNPLVLFFRTLRNWILAVLIMSAVASAFATSRVLERDRNIFVLGPDGNQLQVTSSGSDSDPDLSLDSKNVVFVRRLKGGTSEIWIANTAGGAVESRPLVKMPLEINGRNFNEAFSPRFSPDGQTVFFLIAYAGTTNAIIKTAVARPDPKLVVAALRFQVVPVGKYRGDLIAQIRKAKLALGYYEWYWLLTPDGKEIGVVGQDEGDVALFMEQMDQQGQVCHLLPGFNHRAGLRPESVLREYSGQVPYAGPVRRQLGSE